MKNNESKFHLGTHDSRSCASANLSPKHSFGEQSIPKWNLGTRRTRRTRRMPQRGATISRRCSAPLGLGSIFSRFTQGGARAPSTSSGPSARLPWAGLSPGLWPYAEHSTPRCMAVSNSRHRGFRAGPRHRRQHRLLRLEQPHLAHEPVSRR